MNVVLQTRLQSVVHRHHKAGAVGPSLLAYRYVSSFLYTQPSVCYNALSMRL